MSKTIFFSNNLSEQAFPLPKLQKIITEENEAVERNVWSD
jgi:hypothetical protein